MIKSRTSMAKAGKTRTGNRNGVTMLEALTLMSALSLLMAINAVWIHRCIDMAGMSRQRTRYHRTLQRLSNVLREDVRHCQQMSLQDGTVLQLSGPDERITTYTIADNFIYLHRKDAQRVEHRDRFDLLSAERVFWDESEMPNWITLIVLRRSSPFGAKRRNDELQQNIAVRDRQVHEAENLVDLHLKVGPNPWFDHDEGVETE